MKPIFTFIAFTVFCISVTAQGLDVPENYDLTDAQDYAPYEDDLLDCIEWMQKTPLNTELETRKKAAKFVMDWINGSPDVSILIDSRFLPFMKSSPHLLLTFMAGWTERDLKTRDYGNNQEGVVAGLKAVLDMYVANIEISGKDKNLKKLMKLESNGELEEWVSSKLSN
ncbi:MAG: hypothetical protein AB8B53_07605 [Flavobacteriales bacterium]